MNTQVQKQTASVRAMAVASIGNFSVGFDVLGVALDVIEGPPMGDVVEVSASDSGQHQLLLKGEFAGFLPTDEKENLVWQCLQAFIAMGDVPPLKLVLSKNLPISSGLGSSASSIVAAAAAINEYLHTPLDATALLQLCGRLEGGISGSVHLDNVAPSLLGGLVLCAKENTSQLPFNPEWQIVVAYSGQEVSTRKMREVLPAQYPAQDVIKQLGKLSLFVHALHQQQWALAESSVEDALAEPRRAEHIAGFIAAKEKCQQLGALAVGISGSGPTLFALCRPEESAEIAHWLKSNYVYNPQAFTRICRIRQQAVTLEWY